MIGLALVTSSVAAQPERGTEFIKRELATQLPAQAAATPAIADASHP